jgi:hypothetical protein
MKEMIQPDVKINGSNPDFIKLPGKGEERGNEDGKISEPEEGFVNFLGNR